MKIVISGYYGFGNAGDELILESIIAEMRSRSAAEITVLSAAPAVTAKRHGVTALNRWNWVHVVRAVSRCDVLVSGGGGLFQDATGSLSLYYYLLVIFLAKFLNKKVFMYAIGVNRLKKLNGFVTARVLNLADRITVREADSKNLLTVAGCDKNKIELVADPVLLRTVVTRDIREKNPRIAFILRPQRHQQRRSAAAFAQLADSLSQRLAARIIFIPFQPLQDREFSGAVKAMMNCDADIVAWENTDELCDAVAGTDLVISQRLHGLILAVLYGLPLLGISDDPKIGRFLKELGQQNIADPDKLNHDVLLPVIMDIWEWREEFRKNARLLLPSFKARARLTPELLAELVATE
jgi:polysaccharide pyruvyl transferase CsaB